MSEYVFQQKIKTIAQVWEPFDHKDFHFEAHEVNFVGGTQGGWIASRTVTADHIDAAFQEFFSELYPLVDKISFVTQCFAVVDLEPYLIMRTDRPEFFLQHSNERGYVPLHFGPDERKSLEALEQYEQKGEPFRYLREAINAPDFYTRLAMLASALEGIAGEKKEGVTNREYIKKEILRDDDLYEKIFKGKTGIRNQLLHGKKIDGVVHGNTRYVDIVYEKIVNYFNEEHKTKIKTNVKNAPRTIGRSYNVWRGWLKPVSDGIEVNLKRFCGLDLHDATKDFASVDRPSDY